MRRSLNIMQPITVCVSVSIHACVSVYHWMYSVLQRLLPDAVHNTGGNINIPDMESVSLQLCSYFFSPCVVCAVYL